MRVRFEALKIVPVFITFYQIFGVIGGGLYYEEFEEFLWQIGSCFLLGVWYRLLIYILSMKPGSLFADAKDEDSGSTVALPLIVLVVTLEPLCTATDV